MVHAFDAYELDTDRFELRRAGEPVPVEPQVFDVLAHLVAAGDRVVTKEELLDAVWGDRFVSESALTSRIKAARRAVGDDGQAQRVIRTVHGRGYRFVAPVTVRGAGPERYTPAAAGELVQEIRFCRAGDGVRLAYGRVGAGPPLVKAANWLSHLRCSWESVVWRHWFRDLARHRTLVHYDERGCGMSDWDAPDVSFEAWVRDLETVVDAAGLDRFPLLGVSQGGAVSIAYAVRHPERVTGLILCGSYAQGRVRRARTDRDVTEARLMTDLVRVAWGSDDSAFRQVLAARFMPQGTLEQWEAFDELQRVSATPENAARLLDVAHHIDVTELAPQVGVPTLVLHAADDHQVPVEQSRLLAALVPGSRLVELPSPNHILMEHEPGWKQFLDELDGFLGDA